MIALILFFVFICINIGIAYLNNAEREANIMVGIATQVNHPLWTVLYCILVALAYFYYPDFWISGALLLQRASVFPVAFNLFSKLPPFHLSATSTSKFDQAMVSIGLKDTEVVNLIAFAIAFILVGISFYFKIAQ